MQTWIDITRPLYHGMPAWPGDPPAQETPVSRLEQGDACNVSLWAMSSHTGTHVDPPLHFIAHGPGVDRMPLDALCGPCHVLDVSNVDGHIPSECLEEACGARRVLLKTRNSFSDPSIFHDDFAALTQDAADVVLRNGLVLIGVDGPSVEPFHSLGHPIHHALLNAGVVLLEGLLLADVEPGGYELVCAPLPLRNGDGAPCRALLRPIAP